MGTTTEATKFLIAIQGCLEEIGIPTTVRPMAIKKGDCLVYEGRGHTWYIYFSSEIKNAYLSLVGKPKKKPIKYYPGRPFRLNDPQVFEQVENFIYKLDHPKLWARRQKQRNSSSPSGTAS